MEIDGNQLREFVLWFIDLLYQTRGEVIAYQVTHSLLAPGLGSEFDQVLRQARANPSPALLADHQKARDTISALLTAGKIDDALEFLRQWKPKGTIQ